MVFYGRTFVISAGHVAVWLNESRESLESAGLGFKS